MIRETYDFSTDFQDLIIACVINHPEEFSPFGQILESKFFLGVHATIVAQCALEHNREQGRFPSWEALGQMSINRQKINVGDDEDAREKIMAYVKKLKNLDTGDVNYVISQVINFAKERATLIAIKANIADIQAGKIDPKFITRLEEALNVGQNLDDLGYILHRDAEEVVRKITKSTYGLRTGFHLLDQIWHNGIGPGWLFVILAPPKRYKTAMCLNLAVNIISPSIGENVFYYTCEISQELALARVLYNLVGRGQSDMYRNPEKFIISAREQIQRTVAGNLVVKGFPSKTARISDIKSHAKNVIKQTGIRPKAIFIDYAETIAPSDKNMSEHQQSASVYTEARAMGAELACSIYMPDRCTRETVSMAVPNMTSFQGAFQKGGIVDAAMGICSTEAEYINNILRFFIFINRHGQAHQHLRGTVDPEAMQIEINETIEYEPEDEVGRRRKTRRTPELPDELKD
jgi:KaiC/GvpD/RAD55 family RecA-like ATPase